MNIEAWVPTVLCLGAFGVVWWGIRTHNNRIDNKVDGLLAEKEHDLLCENNTLKINAHFSNEMNKLKDELFKELRDMKSLIKNGRESSESTN